MADFLVAGVTGQDGALLAQALLSRGFSVIGTHRRFSPTSFWRLEEMGIVDQIRLIEYEVGSPLGLQSALMKIKPIAAFFTVGDSSTASSASSPARLMATNAAGCAEQIEVLRSVAPETIGVFFSSSEVFGYGESPGELRDESSPRRPSNPYGVSKVALGELVSFYRTNEGLKLFEAILFPHESYFRGSGFLVKKVVRTMSRWYLDGSNEDLPRFGSLASTRDWGSASEYMGWLIDLVVMGRPDSYVIGTGRSHSVWDIFQIVGEILGFELAQHSSDGFLKIAEASTGRTVALAEARSMANVGHGPIGSLTKLRGELNSPEPTALRGVLAEMVSQEISRATRA